MPKISDPGMLATLNAAAGSHPAINPKIPLELTHSAGANALQQAEINRQGAITSKTNSDASTAHSDAVRAAALARTAAPLTQAELTKAQAEAVLAQQKVDETKANQALSTMAANSNVHGDAYLKAYVPPSMWNVVKAYARGDLGSRSGGLSTSMLPIIQHAMNYDPSASGVNFPARVKMQSDLASGDPKTAGGSLQAFERMLLHGSEVLDAGGKLNNFRSGLPSLLNYPKAGYESLTNDQDLAHFHRMVGNYSPEAQKAIAGVSGGQEERLSRVADMAGSVSPEALVGGLQADAKQAFDAMQATNDRYKRVMGHDILDAMSPAAKAAYDKIMAGGYDPKTGKAINPSDGWVPISGAAPGNAGGNGTGNGGAGQGGPGAPPVMIASGSTRQVPSKEGSAIIDAMLHAGASDDQIDAALAAIKVPGVDRSQSAAARAYLAKNPGYKGGFGAATTTAPNSILTQAAGSSTGVGIGSTADNFMGGLSDEIGAIPASLATGQNYWDTVEQLNAKKQAAFGEHPLAAGIGGVAGNALQLATGASLLKGTALAGAMGRAAPYAGAALQGAISGAGQDNDNRLRGAAVGGVLSPLGYAGGKLAAIPVGALARTGAGQAVGAFVRKAPVVGRMFGAQSLPAAAPSAADNDLFKALADPSAVQSRLGDAAALNVPMSLADASPQLTALGGQAVRRSPTASGIAENAFLPRARGQIDRFGAAIDTNLGPTANIPQMSADLSAQAKASAKPLFDKALNAPGASSVKIDDLMTRPSFQSGLQRARNIALEAGEDPTTLGFDLDNQGQVVLNRVPSFKTLHHIKTGLDDALNDSRDAFGNLQLNAETHGINDTRATLLKRIDAVNDDYKQARASYAGPMQSRDALALGQKSVTMDPATLSVGLQGKTPEQLAQIQLGNRSGLMGQADKLRFSSNPFDAVLGTPAVEQRMGTLYGADHPGVSNLFATRDMEGRLARSSNDILGNSKTAQRIIADQAFAGPDMGDMAAGAVDLAHGGIPIGTIAKAGLTRAGTAIAGKRAVTKADALAPMLFNTDPAAASALIDDLLKRTGDYRTYVTASRPTRMLGMFGAGMGAASAPGY